MTKIEIKIECKGQAVGTLGWLNSKLEESELVIKNTKSGTPGMFLKLKLDNADVKNQFEYLFICKKVLNLFDTEGYQNTSDLIIYVFPEEDGQFYFGLFNNPLTPACTKKVKELIASAVDQYREWWNNN